MRVLVTKQSNVVVAAVAVAVVTVWLTENEAAVVRGKAQAMKNVDSVLFVVYGCVCDCDLG